MPFFRKANRSSSDGAARAKKDLSSKKKRKGGFLRKKKAPLIHCEDASRASSTQPQPRWNHIETDFTGLQPTTKGNVKTPGEIRDMKNTPGLIASSNLKQSGSSDKSWAPFEKNHRNQENIAFPKMLAIQEDHEVDFPTPGNAENSRIRNKKTHAPIDMDEYIEPSASNRPSFPDQKRYVASAANIINTFSLEEPNVYVDDESPSGHSPDDFTIELAYSQSVLSGVGAEEDAPEDLQQDAGVDEMKGSLEMEDVIDDKSQGEAEELDDSNPSMSAYVSLNRISKSDLTYEFKANPTDSTYVSLNRIPKSDLTNESSTSSPKFSRSEECSQGSEWKPKSNMTNPLGATPQEIDALNLFLSVVGPNFNGRKLSVEDRKEIYIGARKVGLNKVLVDKFLDQSAGISTVEEASTFSDLSPCSSYSTTSRSIMMTKSELSDQTGTTGSSRESENSENSEVSGDSIRYKYLPRTSDSPHADRNYGCKGIFGEFLWNDPKKARKDIFKAGKGILARFGAVVVEEDGSIKGEV